MIFYDPFDDVGGGNASVVSAPQEPADGGLPDAVPPSKASIEADEKYQSQINDWLQKHDQMLGFFTGNTAQRAAGEQNDSQNLGTIQGVREAREAGQLSGRDFLQMTGRIDGGIGTGDQAIRDDRGRVTGYQNQNVGGFTPQAQWNSMFNSQMAEPPKATVPQFKDSSGGINSGYSWSPNYPTAGGKAVDKSKETSAYSYN